MLVVCVAVIFNLVSMSQTAPVSETCETLLKPLEMKTIDPGLGDWSLVASSSNQPGARTLAKGIMDNLWFRISAAPLPNMFKETIYFKKRDGQCASYNVTMTLEDNKLSWSFAVPYSTVVLPTCPDCILTKTTFSINGNTYTSLDFASKRRELTVGELMQFKTQVACLNLPSAVFYNAKTEHCTDTDAWIPVTEDQFKEMLDTMEKDVVKATFSLTDYLIEIAECLGWI